MATKLWVGTDTGNEGDWATAANWSPSGVPVSTDDVIFSNSSQSVTDGFAQSAVTLNSLTIEASFTGTIGATESDFLAISATTLVIGQKNNGNIGTFAGSKRLNINLGSNASTITIYSSSSTAIDQNRTPIRLKCNHSSSSLTVFSGSVSLADDLTATSSIGSITNNGGFITVGKGVTLPDVTTNSGTINIYCSITDDLIVKGGTVNHYDSTSANTIADIFLYDGVINHYSSGTITTATIYGGLLDLSKSQKAKTVTTLTVDKGRIVLDFSYVTLTNKIALTGNKLFNINISN